MHDSLTTTRERRPKKDDKNDDDDDRTMVDSNDSTSSNSCNDNNNVWRLTVNELFFVVASDDDHDLHHRHHYDSHTIINPLQTCCLVCAFLSVLTFVVSERTENYSQVDKLWSLAPPVYAWILVADSRTFLMALLVTGWGIRLTHNFHRRGGYSWPPWIQGGEDYRWRYLRDGFYFPRLRNDRVLWTAFNFGFISVYQNLLLLCITTPSVVAHIVAVRCRSEYYDDDPSRHHQKGGNLETNGLAYTWSSSPSYDWSTLNGLDALATILFGLFLILESIADNQQYRFQQEKHRRRSMMASSAASTTGSSNTSNDGPPAPSLLMEGEYADGFTRSGLFAIVRKPNYAAEQAIWMSYYLFSIAALVGLSSSEESTTTTTIETATTAAEAPATPMTFVGILFNWSSNGWILLCALFQMSGRFTEKITLSKYPNYGEYMDETPLYVPNPFSLWKLFRRRRRRHHHSARTTTKNETKKWKKTD
jgi:steroid 5-alpha reductase family enzyme